MDLEANLPSFFNASLFFIGAALFHLHAKTAESRERAGWLLMAAVFIFLGIDEGSQVHEQFIQFTRRLIDNGDRSGRGLQWLYFAWIVPYGAALIGLGLLLFRWFFRLSPSLRKHLLISGAVYLFGAVCLEMVGGKVADGMLEAPATPYSSMILDVYGPSSSPLYMDPLYIATYTLEETFEMTGLILCIGSLLRAFEAKHLQVSLSLAPMDGSDKAGTMP
jgi:hypothetical protein